jgi:hypothetical protein
VRSSGTAPAGSVAADADGACLVCSDQRADWRSVPWGLSKRACLGQMHRMVDPGYCDSGSATAADAFADIAGAAAAAAADDEAVAGDAAGDAAEDVVGTAFGIVRKAQHAGRLAACIPYHASYANAHHREKQCSVRT